jgi:hypothetical protein
MKHSQLCRFSDHSRISIELQDVYFQLFSLSDVLDTPKYTPNALLLGRCVCLIRIVSSRGISAFAAPSRAH